jgi:hypothetical protein
VTWELHPELNQPEVRAALLAAVEQALAEKDESAWWRSGFEELGEGPAPRQARYDPGTERE